MLKSAFGIVQTPALRKESDLEQRFFSGYRGYIGVI